MILQATKNSIGFISKQIKQCKVYVKLGNDKFIMLGQWNNDNNNNNNDMQQTVEWL